MKEELPGASSAMTMGIIGLIATVACCGPLGAIFCFISLSNGKKARLLYEQNPGQYTGIENVKTAKILSIIGLVIAALYLVFIILYFGVIIAAITAGSMDGMQY